MHQHSYKLGNNTVLCNFNRTRASTAALFLSQCSGEFLRHFELLLTDVVDTMMKVTVRIVQLLLFSLLVCGRHIWRHLFWCFSFCWWQPFYFSCLNYGFFSFHVSRLLFV